MSLKIGKAGRETFGLPLDVATWAMAIHGVRGKGKTSTGVVIVEEALEQGVQVVVIDPTDVWWGLKSSKDGKKPGYPAVILGGSHGDLPLGAKSGPAVADFAVAHRVPIILSLRHLRKGDAAHFVMEFAEQLYHRKGEAEHRRPLLLVIDEASRFVPQHVRGDTARMVGAIEDIVRQGRAAGFGAMLIDQRPASVNKDVLTQIELLVCHAVTSPQDRAALREWIRGKDSAGHEAEFERDLASLERGEAWFWLPMADLFARVHVRDRRTFDSSRTPEIGETPLTPERFATVDLSELEGALQDAIEQAAANDPKMLKRRIAELEKELRQQEPAEPFGISPEEAETMAEERAAAAVAAAIDALRSDARPYVEGLAHVILNGWEPPAAVTRQAAARPSVEPRSRPAAPTRVRRSAPTEGRIGGPHQKILNALAWLEAIGVRPAENNAVAFIAGYRPGGGAFNNPKGALRSMGLIDYPSSGWIELTEAGREQAEPPMMPRTRSALHEMVLSKLAGPEQRILRPLLDAYPDDLDVQELAEASGYSQGGGAFNNPRGRLRTLGLIDYPQQGRAVACDILFPRGLR